MKVRFMIILITFFFVLLALFQTQLGIHLGNSTSRGAHQNVQPSNPQNAFEFLESAKGITRDGVSASFQTYQSSDGTKIFTRTEFFDSPQQLETRFETMMRTFSVINETGNAKDSQNIIIGKRIVGQYSERESVDPKYAIICVRSLAISYVESVSLNRILDFEQWVIKNRK